MSLKKLGSVMVVAMAALLPVGPAMAGATLINPAGTVALGINNEGHLNTSDGTVATNSSLTGIAYNFGSVAAPDFRDATSPGCFCEGWGVSVNNTTSGWGNVDDGGTSGLTPVSFVNGATTATSVVTLAGLPGIRVTHDVKLATNAPSALFRMTVTIENTTGAAVNDVKYVRVMDWDVPPTEFNEFVTIKGTATTAALERSHDNGFDSSDPLGEIGPLNGATADVDFTDDGPADHGAYFRFNFGSLADGESYTFDIFYGAAGTEADALAAIGAEAMELYSLGQSNGGEVSGRPATFIFGFKGVGGVPQEVPEPGSLVLLGAALAGLAMMRRRRVS